MLSSSSAASAARRIISRGGLITHRRYNIFSGSMRSSSLQSPPRFDASPPLFTDGKRRNFCVLSKEEEEAERQRVATLTPYQREMELRKLDKDIKLLNTYRGINTGELYTWRGKFKALARDYGVGFLVWYWTVWTGMAVSTFVAIEYGGVDAMAIIAKTDVYTGLDLSKKVDPMLGTAALTVAVNELLEPIRLVFVVVTTKPVVKLFRNS